MRLAREDDLDRALRVAQHPLEAVELGEQEPRALVRGEPAREADGQIDGRGRLELGRIEGASLWRANRLRSRAWAKRRARFLAQVRVPEILRRDALDALPEPTLAGAGVEVVEVRVEVAGEQVRDRRPDPRRAVDAVGDAEDVLVVDALPRRVRGLRVELADGVGAVRQAQRERGHVELAEIAVHPDAQLEDLGDRHAAAVEQRAGDASHELGIEALLPPTRA